MMELLYSLSLFLLLTTSFLQFTYGADSNVVDEGNKKCQKTTLDGSLNTKILLRDECNTSGKIDWLLLNSNDGSSTVQGVASTSVYADDDDTTLSHIIQFRKAGQQSFTVCLMFPDLEDKRVPPFSVHHLRGKSKKQIRSPVITAGSSTNGITTIIPSPSAIAGSPVCIASQCSHVSLMLQTSAMGVAAAAMANHNPGSVLQGRNGLSNDWPAMDAGIRSQRSHQKNNTPGNINVAVGIKYQFALDQRCPKCTDQCMKNIFCSSSYMFVGTVTSSEQISEDGRGYKSIVKLERFIKYDNRFTEHSGIRPHPSCENTTPSSSDVIPHTAFPTNRKIVTVYSTCYLKLTGRYLISANYRAGLKNKGRLAVACAQEDIDYSLYVLKNIQ